MTEQSAIFMETPRTLKEVAEIVDKTYAGVSLAKNRLRSGKSKDKGLLMLYRFLFNVDDYVIDFFLDDRNFGADGFYLRKFNSWDSLQRHFSKIKTTEIKRNLQKNLKNP